MSVEAELLRYAAAVVRREGAEATPGPWTRAMKTRTKSAIVAPTPDDVEFYYRDREHVAICSVPHFDGGGGFVRPRSGRDLDWIALMGPRVAEPLAAWLDAAATTQEEHPGIALDKGFRGLMRDSGQQAAVDLVLNGLDMARALLGEATS